MSADLKLEIMTVRVPQGSLAQIDRLLKGGELRSKFIRRAVSNEIVRRYREKLDSARQQNPKEEDDD